MYEKAIINEFGLYFTYLVSCSVLVVNLELVNENREWTHVRAVLLICTVKKQITVKIM